LGTATFFVEARHSGTNSGVTEHDLQGLRFPMRTRRYLALLIVRATTKA
jgi:hypothetical protein